MHAYYRNSACHVPRCPGDDLCVGWHEVDDPLVEPYDEDVMDASWMRWSTTPVMELVFGCAAIGLELTSTD